MLRFFSSAPLGLSSRDSQLECNLISELDGWMDGCECGSGCRCGIGSSVARQPPSAPLVGLPIATRVQKSIPYPQALNYLPSNKTSTLLLLSRDSMLRCSRRERKTNLSTAKTRQAKLASTMHAMPSAIPLDDGDTHAHNTKLGSIYLYLTYTLICWHTRDLYQHVCNIGQTGALGT